MHCTKSACGIHFWLHNQFLHKSVVNTNYSRFLLTKKLVLLSTSVLNLFCYQLNLAGPGYAEWVWLVPSSYLSGPGYSIKQAAPIPVPMHMETTPNALKIVITKLYMYNSTSSISSNAQAVLWHVIIIMWNSYEKRNCTNFWWKNIQIKWNIQ